jgi:hypothetical protein
MTGVCEEVVGIELRRAFLLASSDPVQCLCPFVTSESGYGWVPNQLGGTVVEERFAWCKCVWSLLVVISEESVTDTACLVND